MQNYNEQENTNSNTFDLNYEQTPNSNQINNVQPNPQPKAKISIPKIIFMILSGPIIMITSLLLFSVTNTLINDYQVKAIFNFILSFLGLFGVIMLIVGPILGIIMISKSK